MSDSIVIEKRIANMVTTTFNLREDQLEALDALCKANGHDSRSRALRYVIDQYVRVFGTGGTR